MRLQAGAKYPSSELVDCCACPCGRWSACLSAQASQRHDHNPADAQMLALRRAVLAHATPRPQQRQAARDAGNALLSPGRPLLQRGVSQGCFQGAPTFFNRRPEGGKNVAPICPTIDRRPRQKFCRCFNALRVQENRSRVLPSRPARLPHQCFGRLPLSAGEAASGRRAMKQESESRSTRFLFVHDGRACCGHLISRGPNGWEAFDRHGESVGTFASLRDAAAALPRIAA
jgi:hypothetical protein